MPDLPPSPMTGPRSSPLHRAVSDADAERLWALELANAETDDDARRFLLRLKTSTPPSAVPDIPRVPWPRVEQVDDLGAAVNVVLRMHGEGAIDAAGVAYLTDILARLAKVFEVVDLAPQVREIRERLEQSERP